MGIFDGFSFSQLSSVDFGGGTVQLQLCKPDCGLGKKRPCIKKCCPMDKIFQKTNTKFACASPPEGSIPFMPIFYDDLYTKSKTYGINLVSDFPTPENDGPIEVPKMMPHIIINHPKVFRKNCVGKHVLPLPSSELLAKILSEGTGSEHSFSNALFRLRTDGALMYKSVDNKCKVLSMTVDTFCIEGVRRALTWDPESPFNNTEDEYVLFQCRVAEKDVQLVYIT